MRELRIARSRRLMLYPLLTKSSASASQQRFVRGRIRHTEIIHLFDETAAHEELPERD